MHIFSDSASLGGRRDRRWWAPLQGVLWIWLNHLGSQHFTADRQTHTRTDIHRKWEEQASWCVCVCVHVYLCMWVMRYAELLMPFPVGFLSQHITHFLPLTSSWIHLSYTLTHAHTHILVLGASVRRLHEGRLLFIFKKNIILPAKFMDYYLGPQS